MSKYLKSGTSHYLKSKPVDTPAKKQPATPESSPVVRNHSGFTDNDERLFNKLNNVTQFSINSRRVLSRQGLHYSTPYTTQDITLFNKLFPGNVQNTQTTDSTNDISSSRKSVTIKEFDDHSRSSDGASPFASTLSENVRYYD